MIFGERICEPDQRRKATDEENGEDDDQNRREDVVVRVAEALQTDLAVHEDKCSKLSSSRPHE